MKKHQIFKHLALILSLLTMPQFIEQLKLAFGENPFILPLITVVTIVLSTLTRFFNPDVHNAEMRLPIITASIYILTELMNAADILHLNEQAQNVMSLSLTMIFAVKNYLYPENVEKNG
jgi:hypothetical protein